MYNIVQWHLFDFAEDRPANIGTWRVWYFESISYQLSSNYSSSRSIPLLGDDPPRLWRSSTRKVCIKIQFWMYIVTSKCCISVYIGTSNVQWCIFKYIVVCIFMYIDMDMFESNVSCLVDRSYCGAAKQFHGRHISDAVFMIPPGTNKDDFFLSVPEHEEQLQYGRVLLFFKLALVSSTSMRNDVDLAFVVYLDKYTVNGNVLLKYLLHPAFFENVV